MTENRNDTYTDGMERLDPDTAQQVYDLLGRRNNELLEIVEEYKKRDLEHLESYELLEAEASRCRQMRGILQESVDKNLRSKDADA